MDMQFLEETKMLNYQSVGIQKLINEKRWGELSEFDKIKAISKDFQHGATTGIIAALAPDKIVHTWAEVYYKGQWLALEGVITDNQYLEAVKAKYSHVQGGFMKFAIATKDFQNISVDWNENSTYIQSAAIVSDLGIFPNPDKFFEHYTQHWCKMKDFMYVHFGRKIMNYNVGKMRKSHGK